MVQVVPSTEVQDAFPGVATAVNDTPATLPDHETTAEEFAGSAVRFDARAVWNGMYNKRFGVCWTRVA